MILKELLSLFLSARLEICLFLGHVFGSDELQLTINFDILYVNIKHPIETGFSVLCDALKTDNTLSNS